MYKEFILSLFFIPFAYATPVSVPDDIGKDGISDTFVSREGTYRQEFGNNAESFFWRNVVVSLDANRELEVSLSNNPGGINFDGYHNDYALGVLNFGTPDRVEFDDEGDLTYARFDVDHGTRLQTLGEENDPFNLGVRGEFDNFDILSTGNRTAEILFDARAQTYLLALDLKISTRNDDSQPNLHKLGKVEIPLTMFMDDPAVVIGNNPPVVSNPSAPVEVPEPMSMLLLSSGLAGFLTNRKKNKL